MKKTIYNDEDKANGFLIDIRWPNGIKCPYCDSTAIYDHKENNRRDRFQCDDCNRSFSVLTGTFLHGIRNKAKWLNFIRIAYPVLYEGDLHIGAKSIAKRLNISVQIAERIVDRCNKEHSNRYGLFQTIRHELTYVKS